MLSLIPLFITDIATRVSNNIHTLLFYISSILVVSISNRFSYRRLKSSMRQPNCCPAVFQTEDLLLKFVLIEVIANLYQF